MLEGFFGRTRGYFLAREARYDFRFLPRKCQRKYHNAPDVSRASANSLKSFCSVSPAVAQCAFSIRNSIFAQKEIYNHARICQLHRTIYYEVCGNSTAVWLLKSCSCTYSHTLPRSHNHSAIRSSRTETRNSQRARCPSWVWKKQKSRSSRNFYNGRVHVVCTLWAAAENSQIAATIA